ncbi:Uncharacterized protein SCF082_LOCUS48620 [Durusdinium trenchii]|uniref:Uncharacterized protein n=1 Tax=Durusdinium trenchii TaxID=1381693 RepID=A0ABP0RU11_9DINO
MGEDRLLVHERCQRLTLDEDNALLSKAGYLVTQDDGPQQLWWSANFLYDKFKADGDEKRTLHKWMVYFKQKVSDSDLCGDAIDIEGLPPLMLSPAGLVKGLENTLSSQHRTCFTAWQKEWQAMFDCGDLKDSLYSESDSTVSLQELLLFIFGVERRRRGSGGHVWAKNSPSGSALYKLQRAVVEYLANGVELYVLHEYVPRHNTLKAIPSRRLANAPDAAGVLDGQVRPKPSVRVQMTPDAIYAILSRARETSVSMKGALDLLQEENMSAMAGCKPTAVDPWVRRALCIYDQRATLSLVGVNHFNLVADASTHSGKEENKLLRVASYRQLQAMSQQLNLLSGGHIANLDHFSLPAGVVLKAVPHGSARFTERHDSGRVRAGFAAANGEREMLLPEARSWFAIGKMDKLIIAKWDVIHRAIRDVKLALLHGAGGEFFQAQFHSQYLFSMAYKPFGNSGFFEDKKRLLELMLSKESFDSCPLFDECWEKIRQEVGMEPSSTKKEVWDTLPLLPGFSTKQTMPKLSRWFSWNESAQENVPEWSSLKLCLAYHFDDLNLDPDKAYAERQQKQSNNDGTKSATNMRKEFGRLKEKVGGGLKLCYHIMSEKLLQMAAASLLAADHRYLLQLEQVAATSTSTPKLLTDLNLVFTSPIRLLFLAFEESSYSSQSPGGIHLLRGMLKTLPDSKIVEDIHGKLKRNAKKGSNRKQSLGALQELVTSSSVFETREINDKAFVTKEVFMEAFPRTKDRKRKRYLARLHRLPKEWSEMMARKTWATISEETLHQGTAALCFLRSYMKDNMGRQGIRISHGCFSKFAVELCLMIRSAGDGFPEYLGFCLGNAFWSSLFWPVCLYQDGDFEGFFLDPQGEAEWVHVVNPQAWTVLVHDAVLCGNQILMVVNSRVPLLHFFLEKASHRKALTISDLTSLAEVLSLGRDQFDPKKMNRETLLKAIIDHVGVNDPDWLSKVKDSMDKPVPEKQIGDCLDELLMAELPQEDQREFKEISEEIDNKKRCGWNLAEVVPLDPVVPLEPVAPLEPDLMLLLRLCILNLMLRWLTLHLLRPELWKQKLKLSHLNKLLKHLPLLMVNCLLLIQLLVLLLQVGSSLEGEMRSFCGLTSFANTVVITVGK